ncbi:MAG: hypothetical protein WBX22_02615 [Silvibacterium sp.]|jgi:hypothetical protein
MPRIPNSLYSLVATNAYSLDTRDRPGLLFAMLRTFASDQSRIADGGQQRGSSMRHLRPDFDPAPRNSALPVIPPF